MLNVQTLGILLRALRDGNAYPEAPRAPSAVNGVARVAPVASDPNDSLRGDAAVRALPPLLRSSTSAVRGDRERLFDGTPTPRDPRAADARATPSGAGAAAGDSRSGVRELGAPNAGLPTATQPTRDAAADTRIVSHETRLSHAHALATTDARATASSGHAAAVGTATGASTALAISETGRWLTGVPHPPPQSAADRVRTALPLTPDDAVRAPVLETALKSAISTSGVFYEAHLARWIADDFPLAQIAREPQASWTPTTLPNATSPSPAALPQDAEKLAVVARQLEALDTRAVVWSGMPWPGQHATIEIAEDERDARRDEPRGAQPKTTWKTRITMTLPSLGTVETTLALRDDAIELRLVADDAAQARLAAAREALRAALAARSLELAAFNTGSDNGG